MDSKLSQKLTITQSYLKPDIMQHKHDPKAGQSNQLTPSERDLKYFWIGWSRNKTSSEIDLNENSFTMQCKQSITLLILSSVLTAQ